MRADKFAYDRAFRGCRRGAIIHHYIENPLLDGVRF